MADKKIVIGIDPGAKYTGVCVIDTNAPMDDGRVLHSSTYVRPDDMPPVTWAVNVTQQVQKDVINLYPDALVSIENVTPPQSHYNGKLALINPTNTIRLALVVGTFALANPTAVMVRPGKNGSQEVYPKVLTGTRPKTLPGVNQKAGTRQHERSAYDVAMLAESKKQEHYILDAQVNLFG